MSAFYIRAPPAERTDSSRRSCIWLIVIVGSLSTAVPSAAMLRTAASNARDLIDLGFSAEGTLGLMLACMSQIIKSKGNGNVIQLLLINRCILIALLVSISGLLKMERQAGLMPGCLLTSQWQLTLVLQKVFGLSPVLPKQ